eukprot:TRINITY_DN3023_c0_g1_i2.p1 TRINITY_DN3023_c0_g1~~TRINITY_DN3023_c0_g1_i2.p1  ORF type:complete len:574 (-),score=63.23 TRINITY_DN3023_c0_g1_i2:63-1784(-)
MASSFVALFVLLPSTFREAAGRRGEESYTSNAICRENACINPLFPGINDLPRLEAMPWQCQTNVVAKSYMNFCKDAIIYDPALPSPNGTSAPMNLIVKAQDDAASTMFFFHLSGLGYDAWDHPAPQNSSDPCVRQVWKMVCFTYFPKSDAGCASGSETPYRRPCGSCCANYLRACEVECCDESPKCTFEHHVDLGDGKSLVQTGYPDVEAPSALCTGLSSGGHTSLRAPLALLLSLLGLHALWLGGIDLGGGGTAAGSPRSRRRDHTASRKARHLPHFQFGLADVWIGKKLLWACALTIMTVCLQGCDDVPKHKVGNWRAKSDYLVKYEFIAPGAKQESAVLNSCSADLGVSETVQCSGRGFCKAWDPATPGSISFCSCDRDYADPECRTKRKSQKKAFLFSLFGGFLGLDYFYLGLPLIGTAKLLTLGGLGYWWIADIIRTGSGNIYAYDYRVSPDLPHWVFVLSSVTVFLIVGFVVSIYSHLRSRKQKRQNLMLLQESEESRRITSADEIRKLSPQFSSTAGMRSFANPRAFGGYGSTMPAPVPNANAPYAHMMQAGQVGPCAGPYGSRIA